MSFDRKVLMPDGTVRAWHYVRSIRHDAKDDATTVTTESYETREDFGNIGKIPYTQGFPLGLDDSYSFDDAEAYVMSLPAFEEYVEPAQAALDEVLPILTDEQAEQVPGAFPAWAPGIVYAKDWRVRYTDVLWKCLQAHTSQEGWEPGSAPSLWVRVGEPGEIPEWVQPTGAHDAYAKGDHVMHNGSEWVSDVDANIWEPGVYGWSAA